MFLVFFIKLLLTAEWNKGFNHRGRVVSGNRMKTEAEGWVFYAGLPPFRVVKQRSTPTKRVANVKHKEMFPRVM